MVVHWPRWNKIINDPFVQFVKNRDRFLILYGGRGSSKSDFAAKKLVNRCLSEKYFRYILVRKTFNTIKNSQWQNLKDTIEDLGLESLFSFSSNPLEIRCINGNKFIAAGCDDSSKLKSIKDPTGVWYEEDIVDEKDFITITTSIRTLKADYLQEIFTINPEVEGDFRENWFWKRFFQGKVEKSFRDVTMIRIPEEDLEVELAYTVHHSTYKDNRWLPPSFKAFLLQQRTTNPYYFTIYTLGEWGNKNTGGLAYKTFTRAKHLTDEGYDESLPLHVSLDFNVKPYMTMTVWQVWDVPGYRRRAVQVAEVIGLYPANNTKGVCNLFRKRFPRHNAGLFIYGDPAGMAEDTRQEKGHNDFSIVSKELRDYRPKRRVAKSAPPVVNRMGWISEELFDKETIEIRINEECAYTINDYSNGKEAADGTKHKEKFKDENDVTAERYHHCTDANDYFLCRIFRTDFNTYLRGHRQHEYNSGDVDDFAHTEF